MKGTKKNYAGIKITSGIDKHLRQWNVSIYVGSRYLKTFQQEPDSEVLYNYLKTNFPGGEYRSGYEAGYFGYVAHRQLESFGIRNKVLNAADIPSSDKEKRRKNDRVDAKKIAKCIVSEELGGIYIPEEDEEADRNLMRYRTRVVRKAVTVSKQRLKSWLVSKGKHKELSGYFSSYWSKQFLDQVRQLEFEHKSDKQLLDHLLSDLDMARSKLLSVNREIVELSRRPRYKQLVKRLRSIPGIGLITAMSLITELIDMKRFKSLDKLSSFVGIVPDTSGSDTKEVVKGLTRRSNKILRRLLVQSAWIASGRAAQFSTLYHRQLQCNGKIAQKAIIKVSRKLLSIIRAVWLKEEDYQPNYQQAG